MIKKTLAYLWKNKLWWLIPPIIILIILGLLVAFSTTSQVGPFTYELF